MRLLAVLIFQGPTYLESKSIILILATTGPRPVRKAETLLHINTHTFKANWVPWMCVIDGLLLFPIYLKQAVTLSSRTASVALPSCRAPGTSPISTNLFEIIQAAQLPSWDYFL